jgi:predicted HD phosphohydrolase
MSIADEIFKIFESRGDDSYFGEPVSQVEHALQAAFQAEREGADDSLIVAALLHDVGHLLHDLPENIADQGIDAHHEELSEAWLSHHFGPEITEPVKLHVAAKRYLCAVDPDYLNRRGCKRFP